VVFADVGRLKDQSDEIADRLVHEFCANMYFTIIGWVVNRSRPLWDNIEKPYRMAPLIADESLGQLETALVGWACGLGCRQAHSRYR